MIPGLRQPTGSGQAAAVSALRAPRLRRLIQGQGLIAMLAVLIVIFAIQSPYFLTWNDFFDIGASSAVLGILAVPQTYLIISGGFDVSVGSVVALSGVLIGFVAQTHHLGFWVAFTTALLAGALVGMVNGFFVVALKINPLITTLGMSSLVGGLAFTLLPEGASLSVSNHFFNFLGNGEIGGRMPFPMLLFLIMAVIAIVVERFTTVGREIYAIGGNRQAARLAGLRVDLIPFGLYVLSGLAAGVAGVITASQLASATPSIGTSYLLSVVTAVVLGGASLAGGTGSMVGTFIAVVILGVLDGGFALVGYSAYAQETALGVALLIAVTLQRFTGRAGRA
jgi:ribose/xylose/arabinose/galactoside ABC-type transport system permease subunit